MTFMCMCIHAVCELDIISKLILKIVFILLIKVPTTVRVTTFFNECIGMKFRVFKELNVDFMELKSINCYKHFQGKLNFEGGGVQINACRCTLYSGELEVQLFLAPPCYEHAL